MNKGVNGYTTRDILKKLKESVFDYNVKRVILLIGTNDIRKKYDDTIENIELIINKIQNHDKEIEILVESIYPINESDNSKINPEIYSVRSNKKIKELNEKIKEMCKRKKLTYINMYDELIDKDGNLKLEYTKEGLHISDQGYKKITLVLNKYLNKK